MASVCNISTNCRFTYDSQGAVTAIAAVDANNDTHTVAAAYSPAGFLQGKADSWVLSGVPKAGDTVGFFFTPNAEMVAKVNVSLRGLPKFYAYDLAGNMIEMGVPNDSAPVSISEPIVDHIYLGNRVIATVTGSGQVCFIAGGPCDSVCGIAWVAQPQVEAFVITRLILPR